MNLSMKSMIKSYPARRHFGRQAANACYLQDCAPGKSGSCGVFKSILMTELHVHAMLLEIIKEHLCIIFVALEHDVEGLHVD